MRFCHLLRLVYSYTVRLNRLLGDVVISQGGVVPHIAAVSPELLFCQVILRRILGTPPYQIKVNYYGDFLRSRMLTFCPL